MSEQQQAAQNAAPSQQQSPSTPPPAASAAGKSALESAAEAAASATAANPNATPEHRRQQTVPFSVFDRQRIEARDTSAALKDAMAQNEAYQKKLDELMMKVDGIANPEPDPADVKAHAAWIRQQAAADARRIAAEEAAKVNAVRQREMAELQQSLVIGGLQRREAEFAAMKGQEDYFDVVDKFARLPISQATRDGLMASHDPVGAVYAYTKDFIAASENQRRMNMQQGAVETGGMERPAATAAPKLTEQQRTIAIKQGRALGLPEDKAIERYTKALSRL